MKEDTSLGSVLQNITPAGVKYLWFMFGMFIGVATSLVIVRLLSNERFFP